jgi:hypothetical protein
VRWTSGRFEARGEISNVPCGLVPSTVKRLVAGVLLVCASLTSSGHSAADRAGERELADASDFRVRVQAALRMGRAGGPSARPELESGLRDAHPAVRVACAVALGSLGDHDAVPALSRALKTESFPSARSSMQDAIDKLSAGAHAAPGDPAAGVERAKYVVQLGAMRNTTGQRSDLDAVMRAAARAKARGIKGAVVLDARPGVADGPAAAILHRASERKIPVLLVDGSLSLLSQSTARDGGLTVSAHVELSIRRVPQQTLKGTASGNASATDDARSSSRGVTDLQNRAVNGAVESAMASLEQEIAVLAR